MCWRYAGGALENRLVFGVSEFSIVAAFSLQSPAADCPLDDNGAQLLAA